MHLNFTGANNSRAVLCLSFYFTQDYLLSCHPKVHNYEHLLLLLKFFQRYNTVLLVKTFVDYSLVVFQLKKYSVQSTKALKIFFNFAKL